MDENTNTTTTKGIVAAFVTIADWATGREVETTEEAMQALTDLRYADDIVAISIIGKAQFRVEVIGGLAIELLEMGESEDSDERWSVGFQFDAEIS